MMDINLEKSLLKNVNFIASPNQDERPDEKDISLIVIHGISLPPNKFGGDGVEQLFCNKLNPNEHEYYQQIHQLKVSAHLFIKRTGEVIQFVPFNKKSWHAGVSEIDGRSDCNDFSIGIELEGTDDIAYTDKQYLKLIEILKILKQNYPKITKIVGHSDISAGRKTDPGHSFDWSRIKKHT